MGMWIGRNRKARVTHGFDEIALVPGDVTVNPNEVDCSFSIGKHTFKVPILASAMDGVVDVKFAVAMGKMGGLAVLNLEGVQTRYENPAHVLEQIAKADKDACTHLIQKMYVPPIREELIAKRIKEMKKAGIVVAVSAIPQKAERYGAIAQKSMELMQAGISGLLVGVGPGAACTTRGVLGLGVPQVTATVDCAAARDAYHKKTGRYVPIITDGGMNKGGDICKAFACGADAVMIGSAFARAQEAPGNGNHWGMATPHANLPRGTRIKVGVTGSLKQILFGPATLDDGSQNLVGAIVTCMGNVGAKTLKEFQETEIIIAPSIKTEGKLFQTVQGVGMGTR